MRKLLKSMKTLLLVAAGLCVGANAWGYTPTLTDAYQVTGYVKKAYYDISSTNVDGMCPASGDLRFRGSGYGLFNYGSGNRGADVTLSASEGDLIIFEFKDTQNRSVTINSVSNCSKNNTLSSGDIFVFDVSADVASVNVNVGRAGSIIAILVMEKDNSVETANYTINYKSGEDIIKTVSGTDVAVGTVIPVESSFIVDDVKYITDAGQASSLTIASGENVHNIAVSVAPKYSYTVNAKAGNVVNVLAQGSVYSGEAVRIPYSRYINVDGTLYEYESTNSEYRKSVSVTENNQVTEFTYSETNTTNVVYFSEGEEVGTATSAGNNMANRSSNAQCGYAESDINLVNLPAGMYEMTAVVYSNSSGGATIKFQFGDETWDAVVSGASNWSQQTKRFALTSASDIKWLTSGGTKDGLDFVYIRKLYDFTEVIGSADFTTAWKEDTTTPVTLKPGDSYHYHFVNLSSASVNDQNWQLIVANADNSADILEIRADWYENLHGENTLAKHQSGFSSDGNWWDIVPSLMNGADVDMTVTFTTDKKLIMNSKTIGSDGTTTRTYNYTSDNDNDIDLTDNAALTIYLTVSNNCLGIISEAQAAVGVTTTEAGKGWATLYTPYALDFSEVDGLTAYTATLSDNTVTLTKVDDVPANTGVVLKSSTENATTIYSIPVTTSSETPQGSLKGSTTVAKTATPESPIYILKLNANNEAQFMRATSGSLDAGKAYLELTTQAKALTVVFANDPTGIATVNAAETVHPVKRIVNGQLVIEKNGKRYNAAGAEF